MDHSEVILKHGYNFMDIYVLRISMVEYLCMDIPAWISMWISTLAWIIEESENHTDIDMNNRGFLEIHVWICYGFSDQGPQPRGLDGYTR